MEWPGPHPFLRPRIISGRITKGSLEVTGLSCLFHMKSQEIWVWRSNFADFSVFYTSAAKRSLQVEVCSVHRTRRSNSCFAQNRFEAWCECITAGRDAGMLESYLSPSEPIWNFLLSHVEPQFTSFHILSYLVISSLLAPSLQGLDKRVSWDACSRGYDVIRCAVSINLTIWSCDHVAQSRQEVRRSPYIQWNVKWVVLMVSVEELNHLESTRWTLGSFCADLLFCNSSKEWEPCRSEHHPLQCGCFRLQKRILLAIVLGLGYWCCRNAFLDTRAKHSELQLCCSWILVAVASNSFASHARECWERQLCLTIQLVMPSVRCRLISLRVGANNGLGPCRFFQKCRKNPFHQIKLALQLRWRQ